MAERPILFDHKWRDDGGDQPQPHLCEAEHRVLGGDDDVADRRQTASATKCRAMDAADQRHWQLVERVEQPRRLTCVVQVLIVGERGHARHPVEIGAGAEGRARARDHSGAYRRVGLDRVGPPGELGDHALVEGIAHLGPIELEVFDAIAALDIQILESHGLHPEDAEAARRALRVGGC